MGCCPASVEPISNKEDDRTIHEIKRELKDETEANLIYNKALRAENYRGSISEIRDQKLDRKATDIRKWEVALPFDNIKIGGFYDILVTLKERDGAIEFDKLKDKLFRN